MIKHNQDGAINGLAVSLVFAVLLLIAALAFGGWAFSGRQDYKNNADAKINAAVQVAVQQNSAAKEAAFATAAKNPLSTYNGPETYGSLVVNYPKTWSGYVDDTDQSTPINAYFAPGVVPALSATSSVFALRVQVLDQAYAQVVSAISNQSGTRQTPPTVKAYTLPKVPQAVGVEVSGALPGSGNDTITGTMVILPLRANTLEIWTEGTQYLSDFNTYILPYFSFSP